MDEKIREVAQILNNGGVVVIPTDTVYGVAALVDNEEGIRRIYEMKKREPDKPMAILIPAVDRVWNWVEKIPRLVELCENHWPGATTLIMTDRNGEDIGLRIPDYRPILEIMSITGPVCATSANISGQRAPVLIEDIPGEIKKACDMVADFFPRPSGNPSKVLDARDKNLKVIRG